MLRAQELGAVAPRACTREFRTILLPVVLPARDARGPAPGRLQVRVRRARTGQLLRREVIDVPEPTASTDAPPGGAEIPPGSVPRGPARPLPYEEHEVPGAPGTPAGAPRRPPPPAPKPPAPAAPSAPRGTVPRRVGVVDDGMLSRLRAAGDTLTVEVRTAGRVGRGRVIVAADRGGCHVVLVSGPRAIVLR